MTFKAQYPGTCPECSEAISPGDPIDWVGKDSVAHTVCPVPPPPRTPCPRCFLEPANNGTCGCEDR